MHPSDVNTVDPDVLPPLHIYIVHIHGIRLKALDKGYASMWAHMSHLEQTPQKHTEAVLVALE